MRPLLDDPKPLIWDILNDVFASAEDLGRLLIVDVGASAAVVRREGSSALFEG